MQLKCDFEKTISSCKWMPRKIDINSFGGHSSPLLDYDRFSSDKNNCIFIAVCCIRLFIRSFFVNFGLWLRIAHEESNKQNHFERGTIWPQYAPKSNICNSKMMRARTALLSCGRAHCAVRIACTNTNGVRRAPHTHTHAHRLCRLLHIHVH